MRSALLFGAIALGSLAGSSFAQGQHAAVSAGYAAPPAAAHPATSAPSALHAPANHHPASATSPVGARTGASKPNSRSIDSLGASTMAPRFVGPVSVGGSINPLNGTNRVHGQPKNKPTNEIIVFGGGYGYGYVPDDSQLQAQDQTQDQGQEQGDGQQSGGQQEPQYSVAQQASDLRGRQQQGASDQVPIVEPETTAPLPDVGSFTLVTRGGYRLEAVAFTRSNDRLVYITPDGGRRTIAVRDLDLDSTQRLNQELGTPIDIPTDEAPATKQNTKPSAPAIN